MQKAPIDYKANKPHAELIDRCMRMWNELRERKTPKARKAVLVVDILKAISGKVVDVVMRHDASRIVQGCMKHGTQAQRDSICKELFGQVLELTKAKHGHQLIEKMLRYGSAAVRTQVHKELKGHMVRLMTHNIGSQVVETGFQRAWTTEQCWDLYQELFGPEFVNFKVADAPSRTLAGVLEKAPTKRKAIMEHMYYTLSKQIDKGLMGHTVAQRLLCDYLLHAPPEQVVAMVGQLKEQLISLLTTREGARAAALCFAYSTPKDRKALFKSLKSHMLDIACHDHAHMALIAALAVTDDTRMSGEAVFEELAPHFAYLSCHRYGRLVLLYLFAGASPRYLSRYDLTWLEPVTLPAYLVNRKTPAAVPEASAPAADASAKADAASALALASAAGALASGTAAGVLR
ncbi:MAG: hypothetical protein EOO41_04130, partial [Methanobacteriota archaeon]